MAKQVINNAEQFSSIRGKLNSNFDELYSNRVLQKALPLSLSIPAAMVSPPTVAVIGPGSVSGITNAVWYPYNTSPVTFRGVRKVYFNALSADYWQNQCNGANGSGAPVSCVEFDHDGTQCAINFRCAVTNSSVFWTWVDGVPISTAPVVASANTSGNSYSWYRLTFGSRAQRRIRIYFTLADFGGVVVGPTDAVWPSPAPQTNIAVVGDSWVAGAAGILDMTCFAQRLGMMLDAPVFSCGFGGTGFSNAGSFEKFGSSNRIAALVACNPTHVIVAGSINDSAVATGTVTSEADALFTAIRSQLPNAQLFATGVQTPSAFAGNSSTNHAAILASVVSKGGVAIDTSTWFSGSGRVGATTGTGNRDVATASDGAHLTQLGHDYYAGRLATAVQPYLYR